MALVSAGTIGNYLKRTATTPPWAGMTCVGFFQIPTDTDQLQTIVQVGGSGGFIQLQTAADGLTLTFYHDWGSITGTLGAVTPGTWYRFSCKASASRAFKMRVLNHDTGVGWTVTGTNPTWATNVTEVWLAGSTYSNRATCKYAGWRLWDSEFSDAAIDTEWEGLDPVITSGLVGNYPMDDPASVANNLIDQSATGADFVETGTGFTVDSDLPTFALPIEGGVGVTLQDAVLSAAGKLAIAGQGNTTLADAVLTAAGALRIQGASSSTLDDAVLSAAGKLLITGQAGAVLENAVLTAAGVLVYPGLEGTVGVTLQDAVLTAAGKLLLEGDASITLEDAVLAAAGKLLIQGAAGVTLEDAVLTAVGISTTPPISGAAAVQLEDAVLSAAGRLLLQGSVGVTLEDAVLSATGRRITGIVGTVNVILADAVLRATARKRWKPVFHDAYVVRADDVADYLANRFTPPRKKGRRLSTREQVLVSQRDDMFRRRSQGT